MRTAYVGRSFTDVKPIIFCNTNVMKRLNTNANIVIVCMKIDFLLGIVLLVGINSLVHQIVPRIQKNRWYWPIHNWAMVSCCTGYVMNL